METLISTMNSSMLSETVTESLNSTRNVSHSKDGLPSGYSTPHLVVTAVLVSAIILIIVVGNFLVVLAIYTDRNLKSKQNWFIASLAVADFLLGLVIMPFSLANELMGYWYFGPVWCDLWKAIDVFTCTASILSICLISLDRYWSITRAIEYSRQRTSKRAAMMITAVWLLSAIICVPPLIGWKNPLPVTEYPLCLLSEDIGYVWYSCMGSFYIPAVIMVFVYYKIYRAAKARANRNARKKNEAKVTGNDSSSKDKTTNSKNSNLTVKDANLQVPEAECQSALSEDESTWPVYQKPLNVKATIDEKAKLLHTNNENENKNISDKQTNNHLGNVTKNANNEVPAILCDDDVSSSGGGGKNETEVTNNKQLGENRYDSIPLKETNAKSASANDTVRELERQKRKLAKARERRATIVLGLVMAAFIVCWFPFFTLYVITSLCRCIPDVVFKVFFWAGYCNSALNPIIYTVFNRDFRLAFKKILQGKITWPS